MQTNTGCQQWQKCKIAADIIPRLKPWAFPAANRNWRIINCHEAVCPIHSRKEEWGGQCPPPTIMEMQQQMFVDDPVVQKINKIPRYKIMLVKEGNIPLERKHINSPQDVYNAVREIIGDADREYFMIVILNNKYCINGVNVVSIGTLSSSPVHPREVFKAAILANAAAIVLVHNHPSGDPTPSKEDIEITRKLVDAGKVLGIEVLDHVVIGDRCVSLKEQGYFMVLAQSIQ